ncbi:MAG: O-antigen ligase family protein [Burkholderiaceae bacterium]
MAGTLRLNPATPLLRWLVIALILFPIVVDQINGYWQVRHGVHLPVAVAYRGAMIALLLPFVLKARDQPFFRFATAAMLGFVLALPFWALQVPEFSLVAEVTVFIKIAYLLIVILFMAEIRDKIDTGWIVSLVITYGLLVAAINVLAFYGGFGLPSYGADYGFGTKAFFKAGNDLGLTLIVCLCICFWWLAHTDRLIYLLPAAIIGIGALLIGSRATLFGVPLLFAITFTHLIFRRRFKRLRVSVKPLIYFGLVLVLATSSVQLGVWFLREVADSYFLARLDFNAIANPRAILLTAAAASISDFNFIEHLTGRGMTGSMVFIGEYLGLGTIRLAEADAHDMISSYGWVLGTLLLLIYPMLALRAYRRWRGSYAFGDFLLLVTIGLLLAHSLFAGHVLLNTMLAPVVGVLYLLLSRSETRTVRRRSIQRLDAATGEPR